MLQIKRSVLAEKLIYLEGKPFSLDLYAPVRAVYDSVEPVIGMVCGRQISKSTTIANFLLTEGVAIPQFRSLFVSPTKEQTSRFSNTRFAKSLFFSPLLKKHFVSHNVAANNVTLRMLTNGSEFYFSYASDEADRVRGISADRVCVTGDTRLFLEDGSTIEIDQIVTGRMIGTRVLSLNEESWKLEPAPITAIFIQGKKPVLELTTESGRRIKATADHKILVKGGWKPLGDITAEDYLPVVISYPPTSPSSQKTKRLPLTLLKLCGYLLGDGTHKHFKSVRFSSTNCRLVDDFAECVNDLGGVYTRKTYKHSTSVSGVKTEHVISIYGSKGSNKSGLKATLRELGIIGQCAYTKRIPFLAHLIDDSDVCAFLGALYATDGCICLSNNRTLSHRMRNSRFPRKEYTISYVSTSRTLAEEIQFLLLRLGIDSVIRIRKPSNAISRKTQYIVQIRNRKNAEKFLLRFNILGKERKCDELRNLFALKTGTNVRTGDRIPVNRECREAMAAKGVTVAALRKKGIHLSSSAEPERDKLQRLAAVVNDPVLLRYAYAPLKWEKIRSITPVGEEMVYDLTVAGNHNFVANGLIAHNCLDEVQDIILEAVEPVIRECSAASQYKYRMYCGTPKSAENDIEVLIWQRSTQNEWVVQCKHCGANNILGWQNIGPRFLICGRCEKNIQVKDGVWFQTNPNGSFPAFRIPQIALSRNVDTEKAYAAILEKQRDYSRAQFNNEVLGISDSIGARMVSLEMMERLCQEYAWVEDRINPKAMRDVTTTVAGVDWSGQSPTNVSRTALCIWGVLSDGRLRMLFGKIFPVGHAVQDLMAIARFADMYNVRILIGDSGEGMLANAQLRQKLGSHRVYGNRYGGNVIGKIKYNKNLNDPGYQSDKTLILDQVMHNIIARQFEFPHWQQFKPFTDDILAAYEETTPQQRRVWKHAATRPDDFLHAMALGWLAAKVATGQIAMYMDQLPGDSHDSYE